MISEELRLINIIERNLESEFSGLNKLIQLKQDKTYEITSLKHMSPKDFKYGEIKRRNIIIRGSKIRKLYIKLKKFQTYDFKFIKYYASLVEFYSVYRIKYSRYKNCKIIYNLFLYHRFHKYNDNMINALKYNLNLFEAEYKLCR